ncbi:MAG TPA: dTDP-glucose 4,6-dehydratase, partial [Halanaerobiales bacterium]|nr:dTDP-glucose 4,6-dehydratase [Halanaerobiales bacterium]
MKILITGGAGFIGSNFIHYLLENYDDQIINIDKLTYAGNLDNLRNISSAKNHKFYQGDIISKDFIEEVFDKSVDYVVNFAAETHVDRSIDNSNKFIKTNVEGTQVLLDRALECDIKNFVQISTDEVYGSIKKGKFNENNMLNPNNPYAASKAGADFLVKSYNNTYNLPVNITRSSNNYGPYQYPEKLIPLFITNIMQDKKLPLYGDGKNIRDWIYVKDNCRAIDLIMRKGKNGEIYNIGANNEKTNLEITKAILKIMNKDESMIRYVKDRPGHDYR